MPTLVSLLFHRCFLLVSSLFPSSTFSKRKQRWNNDETSVVSSYVFIPLDIYNKTQRGQLNTENHPSPTHSDPTYQFNDNLLDLEAQDDGPDETECQAGAAIHNVLGTNVLELHLKRQIKLLKYRYLNNLCVFKRTMCDLYKEKDPGAHNRAFKNKL